MDDHSLAKSGLPDEQIEAIVQGGAPIPEKYGLGTPEYVGLQLARQNHLLGVRNKYLRFMSWAVLGLIGIVGVVSAYTVYTLDQSVQKLEKVEEQMVQVIGTFKGLNETMSTLGRNLSTYNEQLVGIQSEFEKFQDQIAEQTRAVVRELVAMQGDVNDTRKSLEGKLNNSYKE